ncbi:MAG: transketolase [Anaerolineales bacterium]|nr:transketolase [Anaerolineales bacterium]
MKPISTDLQSRAINTLRFLAADAIQAADSGHPGLPMGTAALAFVLWTRHLRHNPANPHWPDRDRFILSGGHGSMLLYALLHLSGYDLPLSEIKNFRQWGSLTPGHPEFGLTPGVEATTGPLGQGFANGIGMAIAEAHLAATFNRPNYDLIDHYTYALVTDGDLSEGVAAEAASLAGHLKLGKLIYLYDDNRITIDGSTDLAFTEDRASRFQAYGWQVLQVADGNDIIAVDQAIQAAKQDARPTLIICRTQIGYGSPNKQGTASAHGEPLGEAELQLAKQNLGWPAAPRFHIPEDVLALFRQALEVGAQAEAQWQAELAAYQVEYPEQAHELERRLAGELPEDWVAGLPLFLADAKGLATRASSGKVLNVLAKNLPELFGGSADLAPSNKTWIEGQPAFQFDCPAGRNMHFGVREHAMGAAINGMALHGGLIPYGGTFLVFSDYMRPAVRLSALSHLGSIWVYTHDSIGLGEDGPTHQPVEHLASLRAMPNLVTLRPADANEVVEAWKIAVERRQAPTALVLSRQNTPTLDRERFAPAAGLRRGAYVLADLGEPQLVLLATGTEVELIVAAGERLATEGVGVRLVSMPSWELFAAQGPAYIADVLPERLPLRIAVEAGVSFGWQRWLGGRGVMIGVDRFGASASGEVMYEKYGLTVDAILAKARVLLAAEV